MPRTELPRVEKNKQRSISIEHDELDVYIAGTRSGPKPLSTKDELCPEMNQAAQAARKKNLTWSIARQIDPEHQKLDRLQRQNKRPSAGSG